jgi:hypothetical protein
MSRETHHVKRNSPCQEKRTMSRETHHVKRNAPCQEKRTISRETHHAKSHGNLRPGLRGDFHGPSPLTTSPLTESTFPSSTSKPPPSPPQLIQAVPSLASHPDPHSPPQRLRAAHHSQRDVLRPSHHRGCDVHHCRRRCLRLRVGIMEMHASRMFLCMRESSCMDECDWLRLVKQHVVRTYMTY